MKTETSWATGVRFLGEQDGSAEQKLKARLWDLFSQTDDVERAYLAHVEFEPASLGTGVALCLCGKRANSGLIEPIGRIFAEMFDDRTNLSVLLVSAIQETELADVCTPFFTSAGSR